MRYVDAGGEESNSTEVAVCSRAGESAVTAFEQGDFGWLWSHFT